MEKYIVRVYLHLQATLLHRLHSEIDEEEEERQERKQAEERA